MVGTSPPRSQAQLQLVYVDRPEISETYVDSLWRVYFDGIAIRMDFAVNRLDDPQPELPPSGKALTASRVVIPLPGMVEMLGKLRDIIAQLEAQGKLRHVYAPAGSDRIN